MTNFTVVKHLHWLRLTPNSELTPGSSCYFSKTTKLGICPRGCCRHRRGCGHTSSRHQLLPPPAHCHLGRPYRFSYLLTACVLSPSVRPSDEGRTDGGDASFPPVFGNRTSDSLELMEASREQRTRRRQVSVFITFIPSSYTPHFRSHLGICFGD